MAPTAERMAIACQDGSIYLLVRFSSTSAGRNDGRRICVSSTVLVVPGITRLVFAPDGRQLAAVGERDIYLLRVIPEREVGSAALVRQWPCRGDIEPPWRFLVIPRA